MAMAGTLLIRIHSALLLASLAAAQNYGSPTISSPTSNCRCTTNKGCFPSTAALNVLNQTVGGRLIQPRPTAYPCYPASLDAQSCAVVRANASDGFWRSSVPGAMESWNLEDEFGQAAQCPLESANTAGAQCQQGAVPLYGVAAISVADVQATVRFAAQNNLRLSIKNQGHDYLGRSSMPGSFLLWVHTINSMTINLNFVPAGSNAAPQPAVTVAGGPHWADLYAKISADTNDRYIVQGGMCPSVGAAGGMVLGGGHGITSPTLGLVVDNVLQMEVVTADGVLHVANANQDQDLFWALKGGGGGTFGVVTSITHRLNVAPPAWTAFELVVAAPNGGNLTGPQMEQAITIFTQQRALWDTQGKWGGYFEMNPQVGFASTFLIPLNQADAQATIEPFVAAFAPMTANDAAVLRRKTTQYPSFWAWRKAFVWPGTNFDPQGPRAFTGSRFIPLSALSDPVAIGKTLVQAAALAQSDVVGWVTVGGAVREKDLNSQQTSVPPAFRTTFIHYGLVSVWPAETTQAGIAAIQANMQAGLNVLRQAYPDGGVYMNEAFLEPNWQKDHWGANYNRLLAIKRKVDPTGLFTCTQCVGSEDYSADGNCRNTPAY